MDKFKVIILEDANNFIDSLNNKFQMKIYRTIELLKKFGYNLKLPHSDYVNKDLRELRIQLASNICRLFYFFHKNKTYIVLSGFVKKDMKLDKKEIEKAMNLKEIFLQKLKE